MAVIVKDWSWQELADLAKDQYEKYEGDPVEKYWKKCCWVYLQDKADSEK